MEGRLVFIPKNTTFIGWEYCGKTVELWETLQGLEIRYEEETIDIIEDYWERLKV